MRKEIAIIDKYLGLNFLSLFPRSPQFSTLLRASDMKNWIKLFPLSLSSTSTDMSTFLADRDLTTTSVWRVSFNQKLFFWLQKLEAILKFPNSFLLVFSARKKFSCVKQVVS